MLDDLAKAIELSVEELYGRKMAFGLFIFDFGEGERVGDYVSNAKRKNMVKAIREIADRIEKNEVIPKTIGEA
jgi:hypothetical protein